MNGNGISVCPKAYKHLLDGSFDRFTTDSGRTSEWLGRPINHALATKVTLSCEGPNRGLIGFYGSADSIRLLTLGIKARQVLKVCGSIAPYESSPTPHRITHLRDSVVPFHGTGDSIFLSLG